MATIELPLPDSVFERVGESHGSYTDKKSRGDVITLINTLNLIEAAAAVVEMAIDDAVAPYDFPLTSDVIAARNPRLSAAAVQERYDRQMLPFTKAIQDMAAADLCLSLRPKTDSVVGNPNEEKRRGFLASAKASLESGIVYVSRLKTGDTDSAGEALGTLATGGAVRSKRATRYPHGYRYGACESETELC